MGLETERALRCNDPGFSTELSTSSVDKGARLILRIALDTPLRGTFDYRPPAGTVAQTQSGGFAPGVRVRVPFGRRRLVGVLLATAADSRVEAGKLKAALEILDEQPVFDPVTFGLLCWAAEYYHHPVGEVFAAALPAPLRAGQAAVQRSEAWVPTDAGRRELSAPGDRRAPRQRELLAWLAAHAPLAAQDLIAPFDRSHLRTLAARGWICSIERPIEAAAPEARPAGLQPSEAQTAAVRAIAATLGRFAAHLLLGVTGSGKTEVYLRAIAAGIANGGQALVLVKEIALTPQLLRRFQDRFGAGVIALHSALGEAEKRDAWRAAHAGTARIVIGTRSAVFVSLARLALIVVDEEHDASYKQHDGFRYSARDLAVLRAQRAGVPIVLGSATPSLETLENVAAGRYSRLSLPQRAGGALPPRIALIDMRRVASEQGISQPARAAIAAHLAAGGQIIVYLNRRGYAPCLYCNHCGWVAPCAHCDARMILHRRAGRLRCHHCGAQDQVPQACAACGQALAPVGQGTERVEETLARWFPAAPLARLDRDIATSRAALEALLERVRSGEARILVGTQMLSKGHDFPDVSLVVVLDADQGLFASDFRATERLAQSITQVAGRAGRGTRAGEVLIQTAYPEHPLLTKLIGAGYEEFAAAALAERRAARWPPYSRLALLRAEARDADGLHGFLGAAAAAGRELAQRGLEVLGPASALIARRADHFRAHLLIASPSRGGLQRFLGAWLPRVAALPGPKGLRWSLDVDPLEVD